MSEDVHKIQNPCVDKASPVALPEVIKEICSSPEKLFLIVDTGSSSTIVHDGIGLKAGPGSDSQTKYQTDRHPASGT